jgi:ferredoxin
MRVIVDTGRCVGAGQCVLADPEVFDQSEEDGTSLLLQPVPPPTHRDAVRDAADRCPARAIRLE